MLDAVGGLVLAIGTTKTNTFNSAAIAVPAGSPYPKPIWAKFFYADVDNASGAAVISFTADWSTDGSTWTTAGIENLLAQSETIITTSTTPTYGTAWLPIITYKAWIRLNIVFSSTTGTPTGDFGIYLVDMLEGPFQD